MSIYSVFVETLIIKAPDLKALYIWKNHWKTLTGSFIQIYKTKNCLIDQLKYRKCRKESLTRNWIQRVGKLQRNEGIWPITFIVKEKCPIKFNLIVFFLIISIFYFLLWTFIEVISRKTTLNQDQKEESRSKVI